MGDLALGIDPGPVTSGVSLYCMRQRRRIAGSHSATHDELRDYLRAAPYRCVAIERFQASGRPLGADSIETIRHAGRVEEYAIQYGHAVRLVYRREVLRALDVTGRGSRDAMVRARMIEIHGGSRAVAIGRKAAPGPLYGVASHEWQALAVAYVAGVLGG